MKIEEIDISNYKVLQNFHIDFKNTEGNILDTVVIAGINGTGKTTILESISNITNLEDTKYQFHIENDDNTSEIVDENNSYPNPKGLASALTVTKFNKQIVYFKVSDDKKEMVISQIKNFIDVIKDTNEEMTIKEANQMAVDTINSIFDGLDLQTKFKGISKDIKRDILFENGIKDDIKLDELSTGEQQLFIRALSLKMMQLKNSIILIDEPEISLHPNWQNQILKVYQNIAQDGSNQLIIATHSPQIIASTPNDSLRVLVKNEESIEVKKFYKSYGADIEEVLADFMDTKYLRTPQIAIKIQDMWSYINSEDIDNFNKIYLELSNILDINDKDLVLTRLEKARFIAKK